MENQACLESAILTYQKAKHTKNKTTIDLAYESVCKYYEPKDYIGKWYQQYGFLYDEYSDFEQEYLIVFASSLAKWKPKNERPMSKFNGSGEFKNYFWSSLQNHFSNAIKKRNASKRNCGAICPICGEYASVLSKHILEAHEHLMWERIARSNVDLTNLTNCPCCKSFKHKKNSKLTRHKQIIQHLRSSHSSLIFEEFNEKYPDYNISTEPISVYLNEDNEDMCLYDTEPDQSSAMSNFWNLDFTPLQQDIIQKLLNGQSVDKLHHTSFKCTPKELNRAIHSIQDAMILAGIA